MMLRPRRLSAPLVALLAAIVLFALFVVNMLTLSGIAAGRVWIARVRRSEALLSATRAALVDAETGQRGFLLTNRADSLEAFERTVASVPSDLAELRTLIADDPAEARTFAELQGLATRKIAELRRTIDLYHQGDRTAALAIVRSDEAKALMDGARRVIAEMRAHEDLVLEERTTGARRRLIAAMWVDGVAGVGLVMLGAVLYTITRDIARRKELERALREAAAFQEQFVAILGHDLRNPLCAISLAAGRLERAGLPEDAATSAARISSSAARMNRMVEQLLDLTRARLGGGIPVQPQPETDLREIARAAIEELRTAHPAAECSLRSDVPVKGWWDPDRIAQVVSNLVANALVHGAGPVEVHVGKVSASAVLTVHNGGPAIPPEFLPRIFLPFHRPADSGNRSVGLGLGLFIAERIVVAHGGTIDVRSTEREGTTFTVHLPSLRVPSPVPSLLPPSATTVGPEAEAVSRR